MSVPSELNTKLSAIAGPDRVDDTKAPDGYIVGAAPAIVFSLISDVPDMPIDGVIAGYQQRWQVSVRCTDLTATRTTKAAVILALQGLKTASIKWCQYEGPAPILVEDGVPSEYHSPIDFLLYAIA